MSLDLKRLPQEEFYKDKDELLREMLRTISDNQEAIASKLRELEDRIIVLEP